MVLGDLLAMASTSCHGAKGLNKLADPLGQASLARSMFEGPQGKVARRCGFCFGEGNVSVQSIFFYFDSLGFWAKRQNYANFSIEKIINYPIIGQNIKK